MNQEIFSPESSKPILVNPELRFHRSLCWKAVFAGVVTAMGIHFLLMALGAGIGLAVFTPLTDPNPATNFTDGSALAWCVCALISLYVGGWVAGCFSAGPKTGTLHGILVWSITLIITFALITTGGGLALGGAVKALGTGLGMTGKSAAGGATELAKNNATQGKDQINSFIDEATKASPTNSTPGATVRAKREISFAVTKLFAPGNDVTSADNQAALAKALAQYEGMSEADAKKMVNDWIASYNEMKAELDRVKTAAEQKAREVSERAAENLSRAATISFFALLMGLILTVCGSITGARKTYRHTVTGIDTTFPTPR